MILMLGSVKTSVVCISRYYTECVTTLLIVLVILKFIWERFENNTLPWWNECQTIIRWYGTMLSKRLITQIECICCVVWWCTRFLEVLVLRPIAMCLLINSCCTNVLTVKLSSYTPNWMILMLGSVRTSVVCISRCYTECVTTLLIVY